MRFEVWAPHAERLRLFLRDQQIGERTVDAQRDESREGWWTVEAEASHGTDYGYLLNDEQQARPDPRSLWQPEGVNDLSRVFDPSRFEWTDQNWTGGKAMSQAIIYELHVAAFGGDLDGSIKHLDYLVDLGVTHVELMPLNGVACDRNWGYDGVSWNATHHQYGGPEALQRFVDAAHSKGLAVLLDVVYNHVGPEFDHDEAYGPYFADGEGTVWGKSPEFNAKEPRERIIWSALTWLEHFHIDGLRLDAVWELLGRDKSETTLVKELQQRVDELERKLAPRKLKLIAESGQVTPALVRSTDQPAGCGLAGEWNDDFHHAVHALITGERQGFLGRYGTVGCLADTLRLGVFGQPGHVSDAIENEETDKLTMRGDQLVAFSQNHDQVGNRPRGDRLRALVSDRLTKVATFLTLTSSFVPMLFMGEEWAASSPFPFFTSWENADTAKRITDGRYKDFKNDGQDSSNMFLPNELSTFEVAQLKWDERDQESHKSRLQFYKELLKLRRDHGLHAGALPTEVRHHEDDRWLFYERLPGLFVVLNFNDQERRIEVRPGQAQIVFATDDGVKAEEGHVTLPAETAVLVKFV